jgi:hypothetical protein
MATAFWLDLTGKTRARHFGNSLAGTQAKLRCFIAAN